MRPLNTRERRIQFFRFLALFLLAVLPIVALVWLFGRVDHVENDFLRTQYAAKRVQEVDQKKFDDALNGVTGRAEALVAQLNNSQGQLLLMTGPRQEGEIKNKITDLEKAITAFQPYAPNSGTNQALTNVAGALKDCASILQEVYKEGYKIIGQKEVDLTRCEDDNKDLQKDLDDCKRQISLP